MAGAFHLRRDLVAIGVLVVGAIIGGFLSVRPPAMTSDAELRRRFIEHRAAFDSLATLAVADTQLVGLGPNAVFVKDAATQNRRLTESDEHASGRSIYRPLLRRAGLPALSRERDGGAIWFVGESHDGSRKGYVYSRKPLQPIIDSLDAANQNGYVALARGWFLFLQSAE